ncbi:MAG: hypothetical protein ACOC0P_03725, partial [Planctomycetota bacterium]
MTRQQPSSTNRRSTSLTTQVVLFQDNAATTDHYRGVLDALRDRGVPAACMDRVGTIEPIEPAVRVVVTTEFQSAQSRRLLREARVRDLTSVLLMDGIVEWRNTFLNPRVEGEFLRPAPCDVIACAGRADAVRLNAWGNIAIPTGLPRLGGMERSFEGTRSISGDFNSDRGRQGASQSPRVLIATAKNSAWSEDEVRRVALGLRSVAAAVQLHGSTPIWRVSSAIASELDVRCDERPLASVLASCDAAITTPSTLMLECMLAGVPTGLLTPYGAAVPVWQNSVTGWPRTLPERVQFESMLKSRVARADALGSLVTPAANLVERLLHWRPEAEHRQNRILGQLLQQDQPPAEALADLICRLIARPVVNPEVRRQPAPSALLRRPEAWNPLQSVAGEAAENDPSAAAPPKRIVNCILCEGSSLGGVTSWAWRLGHELERRPELGFTACTLLIGASADAIDESAIPAWARPQTRICQVDPTMDAVEQLRIVRESIEALDPDIILPNYCDVPWMAALQIRAAARYEREQGNVNRRPVRLIAAAHTDDAY